MLPTDKMPEAEVSLRLAFFLIEHGHAESVSVAIDGAQVRTAEAEHFPIERFLEHSGWRVSAARTSWQARYTRAEAPAEIGVHSSPGRGDVVARLRNGRLLRVEAKKGPLVPSKGSKEYPLLREALGQLLTIEEITAADLLAVAVPNSPKFRELAARWRRAPLIEQFGIAILNVGRNGEVDGYDWSA